MTVTLEEATPPEFDQPFDDIPPWPPTRWTPPLSPDFPSAFDGYRDLLRLVWFAAFGYVLELWQETALRHIFELYPEGHRRAGQLRWRRVVVSFARQNGKTEIAAAIGLIIFLMKRAPQVIGIATSADQAKLIYNRTMLAIKGTPALARRFRALTDTRGIRSNTGGEYQIKASKSAALQGIPIDLALVDELHILLRKLWTDLVKGLGGRPNCMVVGITTAGDENSDLLLDLYEKGEEAIEKGDAARMCFLLWEAPEARIPADDETYGRYLAYANPGVASGRRDLEVEIEESRATPEPEQLRYSFNRFVKSTSTFIPADAWARGFTLEGWPAGHRPIFIYDRTPGWEYGFVTAVTLRDDGTIYCDPVASITKPTLAGFVEIAQRLSRHNPITNGFDAWALRDFGKALEARGMPVHYAGASDVQTASSLFYSKVLAGKVKHPGHPLLSFQVPRTIRKNVGEGFRVSRTDSSIEIDAVMSHVLGVLLAETIQERGLQLF